MLFCCNLATNIYIHTYSQNITSHLTNHVGQVIAKLTEINLWRLNNIGRFWVGVEKVNRKKSIWSLWNFQTGDSEYQCQHHWLMVWNGFKALRILNEIQVFNFLKIGIQISISTAISRLFRLCFCKWHHFWHFSCCSVIIISSMLWQARLLMVLIWS